MHRSTFYLAGLLLAGLCLAVAAPTASAQSAADCPNTVRVVNGCDDYVPARAAPSDPRTEAATRRLTDPAYRAVAVQSARPANGVTAQAAAPASMQNDYRGGLTYYDSRAACTAANPGLLTEDFLEANLASGTSGVMPNPLDENTNNDIFQPGDILPGLTVETVGPLSGDPTALFIVKDGAHAGVFVGSNFDEDDTQLAFAPGVAAVCVDYYNPSGATPLTIDVYDTGGNLLGSTGGTGSSARSFFGVSSAGAAIGSILFVTPAGSFNWTNVSDVAFGGSGGGEAKRVLYAPSEADDPAYRAAIAAALGAGAVVDYFDTRAATPTVAQMLDYDAVYTWTNFAYLDRDAFGNNLATYVDQGGIAVMGTFTTFDLGNSLGGAIRTPGYSPVNNPSGNNHFSSSNYAGDGTIFYAGVSVATECVFRDFLVTQGSGAVDGHFVDAEIMGAYRPDFKVMFMNGDGSSALGCTGDWARLLANMILEGNSGPGCDLKFLAADLTYNAGTRQLCAVVTVRNNGSVPHRARLELDYDRNGGPPQGTRTLGSGTLPAGQQATRTVCLRVPSGAPAGNYNFDLRLVDVDTGADCGSYQETIAISAPRLGAGVVGAGVVGGDFDVESVVDLSPAASAAAGGAAAAPNPFARQTTITYDVAQAAPVRLSVYDVLGREVAVLVDARQDAGAHAATFDARGLAAGTYVYRLTVGSEVQTGRLTLAH